MAAPSVRAFYLLEDLQFAGGIGGPARLSIEVIKLEMRGGQVGVEALGGFEFAHRFVALLGELVQHSQAVMRHGLVRNQPQEAFELGDGGGIIAHLFESDAQVEPGMRDGGIEFLGALQLGDAFLGFAGAQQGQAVIHLLAGGIGRQVQRFLEFIDGLRLGGGVLIEGLAKIAQASDAVLLDARCVGTREQHQRRNGEDDNAEQGADSVHETTPFSNVHSIVTGDAWGAGLRVVG